MRVPIKRYQRVVGGLAPEAAGVATVTEEVDIPARPFVAIGALAGLLPTLVGLFTFWQVTMPNAKQTRTLEINRYRMEMLQRAMQAESPEDRKISLRLLRATGMLQVGDGLRFDSVLTSTDTLPRWCSNSCSSIPRSAPENTITPEGDTAEKSLAR